MKNQSFARRLTFALAGIRTAWRTESSFKFHVAAVIAVLAALLWWQPAPLWWAILALVVGVVLAAELCNTAIEHLADHLHPEHHPQIKIVKDCAAGAVLVTCLAAVAVAVVFVCDVVLR
jgi:diacylglycerol kinase (ATP)